jgi:DNA-binding XRE family transcriptional regulator
MKDLKANRVRLGISQKDLAKMIGVTQQTLCNIENHNAPSPKIKDIIYILNKIEREQTGCIDIPSVS